jgi:hypothetical protein
VTAPFAGYTLALTGPRMLRDLERVLPRLRSLGFTIKPAAVV